MNIQPIEVTTPVGRVVAGNPLETRQVTDPNTNAPKMSSDGVTPRTESYFGLAITKQGEANWWDTPWGAQILQAAQQGWPGNEWQAATFAWKITDGDSQIPNKRGNKPCDQEGYPGHWILNCSTGIPLRCFRSGAFEAHQVLDPARKEIKTGDYGRAILNVRGNAPSQSPGVYLNPTLFELVQVGPLIVTSTGPDPAAAFAQPPQLPSDVLPPPTGVPGGAGVPTGVPGAPGGVTAPGGVATPSVPGAPAGAPGGVTAPVATPSVPGAPAGAPGGVTAPVATPGAVAAPPAGAAPPAMPAPQVQPAPDFLSPDERRVDAAGNAFTVAQLKQAGYTDEQVKALPVAP